MFSDANVSVLSISECQGDLESTFISLMGGIKMNNNSFSLAFTSDVYRMRKLKSVWVSLIIMFLAIF